MERYNMEKQYKIIATAPGEPDIVVELSEAEYADYYERLNNPPKPTLTGSHLAAFLRGVFKSKPLSYRVSVLREVYPLLDILERDLALTEPEYLEFVSLFEQIVSLTMTPQDVSDVLAATQQFVSGYMFSTV